MVPTPSADKRKRGDVQVFVIEESPCVWMTAGVVNFKLCGESFDCLNCAFDKAMSAAWGHEPIPEKRGNGGM